MVHLYDKEGDTLLLRPVVKQTNVKRGYMKPYQANNFRLLTLLLTTGLFAGCFSRLPDKHVVYFNDFEGGSTENLSVYDHNGKVDTVKIVPFDNGKVFGFFNNNRFDFEVKDLPEHNVIKVEFDLYIHDQWDGNHLLPGSTVPDVWQMRLDGQLIYLATFSNGPYEQSFPYNYVNAGSPLNPPNPPRAQSWRSDLPGACALKSQANGSSLYKIEYTSGHSGSSIFIACNDALQPYMSHCAKSWSIDNLRVTAIQYN